MGQSSLGTVTLSDGLVFDIDKEFHAGTFNVAGVAVSGGADSTLAMYILKQIVGAENVKAVSSTVSVNGVPRRVYEPIKAAEHATSLGITHSVYTNSYKMIAGSFDIFKLRRSLLNSDPDVDAFFIGETARWYARGVTLTAEQLQTINQLKIFMPFKNLQKKHIIELYSFFEIEHILSTTRSCTVDSAGLDMHCGQCYCCLERYRGFKYAEKTDPTSYIMESSLIDQLVESPEQIVNIP